MKIVVKFVKEKETSGAVRFQEVDDSGAQVKVEAGAKIGQLYVRKTAFSGAAPTNLTVTLEG